MELKTEVIMARLPGIEPQEAGVLTRTVYTLVRRKLGQITGKNRVVEPVKITAHHPKLLWASGRMEMAQAAARSVPDQVKSLAGIMAASQIGCPF
jgi:hypothetical protein